MKDKIKKERAFKEMNKNQFLKYEIKKVKMVKSERKCGKMKE